jgi:hypothetical protein
MSTIEHTYVRYVKGKVERRWTAPDQTLVSATGQPLELATVPKAVLKNGAAINLLRLSDKSVAAGGAGTACDCCCGAALLELVAGKSFWHEALRRVHTIASKHRTCSIASTITTVAVGVTEQYRLGDVALHFEDAQQPGDIYKGVQQQLHWCDLCARERITLSRKQTDASNQIGKWHAHRDVVDAAPGTVYRDELCIQPDTERDVGKPVRCCVCNAHATPVVQTAVSPLVLPPSKHWHKHVFG